MDEMSASRKARRKKVKKRRTWLKVLLIIVAVLLILVIAVGAVVNAYLSKIDYDDPYEKTPVAGDILTGDISTITEGEGEAPEILPELEPIYDNEEVMEKEDDSTPFDLSRLGELQDALRHWNANGSPVSSKKVINILLMGMDNKDEDLNKNGRSDVMVLISINTETKQIVMTSLLRDAYAYVTNGGAEAFEKMHQSILRGGPALLIQTIERHYKIQIDNYIAVNMNSFPDIIDTLGGIEIDVTPAEAEFLGIYSGRQTLDGATALRYARIRKIDSDVARTGRHQTVLLAMLNKAKGRGLTEMIELIDALLPSVRTGMTKGYIVSLGTQALTSGWLDYEIVTQTFPLAEHRNPQTIDELFYWIVDYPHAARDLQMSIYGTTNINLAD